MALYRRGNTWWVRLTAPQGYRVRRSTGTSVKCEAQEFHDRIRSELWRTGKLGERPTKRWEDAAG